ncbi:TonB-dependent siderophore receptor [Marinagarivorans algicola]|uniref:TonB-dependent siderophore receptor n=1 Tax=Marinagarivorans algicola TaxID=1513270 RepID=UPI0006B4544C|nr:TonB-dependent siderophore receptor [Marinagarivorans algicola]
MKNSYFLGLVISALIGSAHTTAAEAQATIKANAQTINAQTIEEVLVVGELGLYSATKSNTPIMETSRSISIETREQLRDKGVMRLDEAYTYSAGVLGETFGLATRGDWVRVRGLNVPQYQDSLQSLFGNYNNARAEVYTLEQVEILKGPASVLYGKGSPGGIVNIVSKRPQTETQHEMIAEAGSFNHKQVAVDSTGAINKTGTLLYRAVGVYRDSDTQVDFVDDNTVVIAPSLTWQPNDETRISLLANYTKTRSDTAAQFLPLYGTLLPTSNGQSIASDVYLGEPDFNQYDTNTHSLTLIAEHSINETWGLSFTARATDASVDYQQAWHAFLGGERYNYAQFPDDLIPRSFYRSEASSKQFAGDLRLSGQLTTGSIEHSLLIGGQYQNVRTEDDSAYAWALGFNSANPTLSDRTYWLNPFAPVYGNIPNEATLQTYWVDAPEHQYKDAGLYISDHITWGPWNLNAGVRYDSISANEGTSTQDDHAVSTSVGVLYETAIGLRPYINWAESFEPVIGGNGNTQNPAPLNPQEGEQTEIGVKYQPSGRQAYVTLAYFDIEQSNLNDPQALAGAIQQQSGMAKIDGIELESLMLFGDFNWELNLTKLNTVDTNGNTFASVAHKQASTWLGYRQAAGFKAGVGVRYVGQSFDGADNHRTPAYTLTDLMLGYSYSQWDFSLNIKNASNKQYYSTCLARGDCFTGKERMAVGRIGYTF